MSGATPAKLASVGLVTTLGDSLEENWSRLVAGDQSRFSQRTDLIPGETRLFGEVREELPEIPAELAPYRCRNNQLALAALGPIRDALEAALGNFGGHRVGVVVGSSTGGMAQAEAALRVRASEGQMPARFDLAQLEFGGLSEFIAQVSGAAGPCYAISSACSSGAKALVSARSLLELDLCDAVIAGAVDSLCALTANGFFGLQALSKNLTNPMSRERDGLTLGEGAALFLMTRETGGVQLLGCGESSDAHHMSAPEPGGRGVETCMRAALRDADLDASEIAYLNLHGTGTSQNDATESAAVSRVFGPETPCSSTKPLVGHTLGASGAIEAAFCWLLLARRQGGDLLLPPHRFDGRIDSDLPPLALTREATQVSAPPPAAVMTNSFGFGGSNCSLVIGEAS